MPRSRPARATRARSVPGAEGIAISISSGSASSRMRGSWSVAPSTFTPSIRTRCFSGSSSTKPTGLIPSCGLRTISRSSSRPPSPAPHDQDPARALARTEPADRALGDRVPHEAHAADERERQQQEEGRHAGRHGDVDLDARRRPRHGPGDRDDPDHHEHHDRHGLQDAEVVALRHVPPLLLLDAEEREDDERGDDDPRHHAVAQLGEAVGHPHRLVEAQPVRQPPGPGDEPRVQGELDQGVPVERERRAETSAHAGKFSPAQDARAGLQQQVHEELRIPADPLAARRRGAPLEDDVLRARDAAQAALGDEAPRRRPRAGPRTSSRRACRARPPRGSSSRRRSPRGPTARRATARRWRGRGR